MAKKNSEFLNTVIISGKEYQIKTVVDRNNTMRSKIIHKGKTISEKTLKLENSKDEKSIIPYIEKLHRDFIHELSILNNINEEEENKQNIKFILFLGAVYFTKGLLEEAKEIFKKALKWDSNCVEAYNYLGVIYLKTGNIPQAIDYLKKAAAMAPDIPETKIKLIDAYMELDNLKKVEEELTRLHKRQPDYHYVYWYFVLTNLKKLLSGQYKDNEDIKLLDKIIEWMKRGYDLAGEIVDKELFEKAYIDVNARQYESAYKNIKDLIEECKNTYFNKEIDHFHIFLMKYKKEKDPALLKETLDTFTEMLKNDPSNKILLNKVGILHFLAGQEALARARDAFKDSLTTDPAYSFARKNLNLTRNAIRNVDNLIFDFLKQ